MRPAEIYLLDAIPQLAGFKPDLAALAEFDRQEMERRDAARTAASRSPT